MQVVKLKIANFRGIKSTSLVFPNHGVLIGDNNTGKSTILEALDLVLGPERMNRRPVINEHDFYAGEYISTEEELDDPQISIEATISNLSSKQITLFGDNIEFWNIKKLCLEDDLEELDDDNSKEAIRVTFIGKYNGEEDDFEGDTFFSSSLESEIPAKFRKSHKYKCGFLYLRTQRTGSRALSLESGSLLDIILRIKEIRPRMWENTVHKLSDYDVASDPELGISGVLESITNAIKKYVPKEWGSLPRLKVSNLTREHLRKIITAFIATGEGDHSAPFYRQGTGSINILVLAMLSQIAEGKDENVIFAMEEPEIAIPPYTQKRIVHEIQSLASQSIFTSHSPYVLEEFELSQTVVLSRNSDGLMSQSKIELPKSIKHKRYRQEFRIRFCEGLLSRRVLVVEGATEASAIPTAARRLKALNPHVYSSLEELGLCVIDAGGESKIADLSKLYSDLDKQVYALCDKQDDSNKEAIKENVEKLFMHEEKGIENLVLNNTTLEAINRFSTLIEWPREVLRKYPDPLDDPKKSLNEFFKNKKGEWGISDFLAQCEEDEIPEWIREVCKELKSIYEE